MWCTQHSASRFISCKTETFGLVGGVKIPALKRTERVRSSVQLLLAQDRKRGHFAWTPKTLLHDFSLGCLAG